MLKLVGSGPAAKRRSKPHNNACLRRSDQQIFQDRPQNMSLKYLVLRPHLLPRSNGVTRLVTVFPWAAVPE